MRCACDCGMRSSKGSLGPVCMGNQGSLLVSAATSTVSPIRGDGEIRVGRGCHRNLGRRVLSKLTFKSVNIQRKIRIQKEADKLGLHGSILERVQRGLWVHDTCWVDGPTLGSKQDENHHAFVQSIHPQHNSTFRTLRKGAHTFMQTARTRRL